MYNGVGVIPPPATSSYELEGGTLGPQEVHGDGGDGENPCYCGTGPYRKRSRNKNAVIWNAGRSLNQSRNSQIVISF